jgi:AraC family transcriptional regulator
MDESERLRSGARLLEVTYAPERHFAPHVDHQFRISLVLRGHLRETHDGTEEQASTLSVVTKPGDARHADRFGPGGARLLSVTASPETFEAPDRSIESLRRWRWVHQGPVTRAAAGVVSARRTAAPDRAEAMAEAVDGLVDALTTTAARPTGAPPSWLQQVRDRLRATYDRTVPVSTLAEDAGVHPTHLTRRFRQHFGCPVTTYRQQLRVKAAAHAVATTDRSLAAVALDCGFCDQSHLTHVFREHLGSTPGAFRAHAQR